MRSTKPRAGCAVAGAALAAAAVAISGCSSSGGAGTSATPGSRTSAVRPSAVTTLGSSVPSGGPSPSASGSPASPAIRKKIAHAYAVVFGSHYTQTQTVAALQNGSAFAATIAKEARTSRAQGAGVSVTAVSLTAPTLAHVTFTISVNGTPLLPDVQGAAVADGGTWKVAASTFCTLLALQGPAPAACHDAATTSLPG